MFIFLYITFFVYYFSTSSYYLNQSLRVSLVTVKCLEFRTLGPLRLRPRLFLAILMEGFSRTLLFHLPSYFQLLRVKFCLGRELACFLLFKIYLLFSEVKEKSYLPLKNLAEVKKYVYQQVIVPEVSNIAGARI